MSGAMARPCKTGWSNENAMASGAARGASHPTGKGAIGAGHAVAQDVAMIAQWSRQPVSSIAQASAGGRCQPSTKARASMKAVTSFRRRGCIPSHICGIEGKSKVTLSTGRPCDGLGLRRIDAGRALPC